MEHISGEIQNNRTKFLEVLRSGKYKKGTIKSDDKGYPIIETQEDDGYCACAVMLHEFGEVTNGKFSISKSLKALKLTTKDCRYIQREINDTPLNFIQIANRIEVEVFFK